MCVGYRTYTATLRAHHCPSDSTAAGFPPFMPHSLSGPYQYIGVKLMRNKRTLIALAVVGALAAGCETPRQTQTAVGTGAGVATGAAVGAAVGGGRGAAIGAGIGGAVGAAV